MLFCGRGEVGRDWMWAKKRSGGLRCLSRVRVEHCEGFARDGLPLFASLCALDRRHRRCCAGFDVQGAFPLGERRRRARDGGRGAERRVSRGCAGQMAVEVWPRGRHPR